MVVKNFVHLNRRNNNMEKIQNYHWILPFGNVLLPNAEKI